MKSYYGMTSLIQISTRSTDYVIDVFPIWEFIQNNSKLLNEKVFMNPAIVKVMHGA
jgi:exosome complex exonuclease RRP6